MIQRATPQQLTANRARAGGTHHGSGGSKALTWACLSLSLFLLTAGPPVDALRLALVAASCKQGFFHRLPTLLNLPPLNKSGN